MLGGVRIVDRTTDVAGPYCTKLLADAGAHVVREEPAGGDPLRRWRSGALFEHLALGKHDGPLDLADAHVLVTGEHLDVEAVRAEHPHLVVVTVTPYGLDGPWAGRPATELTLQAACGSTGSRGDPARRPVAAGGRIGEWVSGTYAALATVAALRLGRGEHVDVAMLDCMAVTMTTYPSVFAEFLGWPPVEGTGRAFEVPSIEPTADGWAVFTTNSATQFQDFCVMIGRPDLAEDPELRRAQARFARRGEFLAAVHEHTTKRTTYEVLDEAGAFRIPAGPVLDGAGVTAFPHFVERGVYATDPTGRFRRPRPPYRITPGPAVGEARRDPVGDLPLEGIRVLDLTAWWAGPAMAHALGCLGADVVKVESVTRPDLMRFTTTHPQEDRWWEWGPVFHGVNVNKRGVTLDLTTPEGVDLLERLAGTADVLVENYTPRVMEQFGLGWARLRQVNPRLVMVRMPAFGLDGPWRDRTGFAQTIESVSGMAWVTGYEDGAPMLPRGACDPLGGMHAAFACLLALRERERTGAGSLVEAVMVEAALNAAVEQVIEHDVTGIVLGREPQDIRPMGDGDGDGWVTVDGGIEEPVVAGRDQARNPQLRHRRLYEVEDHPVTGANEVPTMPFRFASVDRWLRRPSPTLGQHNDEVLSEVASAEELADLRARGLIGDDLRR